MIKLLFDKKTWKTSNYTSSYSFENEKTILISNHSRKLYWNEISYNLGWFEKTCCVLWF